MSFNLPGRRPISQTDSKTGARCETPRLILWLFAHRMHIAIILEGHGIQRLFVYGVLDARARRRRGAQRKDKQRLKGISLRLHCTGQKVMRRPVRVEQSDAHLWITPSSWDALHHRGCISSWGRSVRPRHAARVSWSCRHLLQRAGDVFCPRREVHPSSTHA
jgi:hypothetical protein